MTLISSSKSFLPSSVTYSHVAEPRAWASSVGHHSIYYTSDLCGGPAGVRAEKLQVMEKEENKHYKQEDTLIKLSKR